MIDVGDYFSTILIASLGCALMFQLPLLVYFLTRIGLISSAFLKKYRRHALVILMTIAAIITPPDIFSLFLVTIPLYFLYELSISLSMRVERKIAAEQQEGVPATVE
jgi:sec-independent protein translocase protein TatC